MQTKAQIKVAGISEAVLDKIKLFMSAVGDGDALLIPMIGLVHSTTHWRSDGTCMRRGNHFVIGAIAKEQLDDEICIVMEGIEIAIRIPNMSRFHGTYQFDVRDDEIVNTECEEPLGEHDS